jgi:nucleoside-diphosphate-sugar epimerase
MKILVTGMEGYIGAQFAAMLIARGHQVVSLDAGFYRDVFILGYTGRARSSRYKIQGPA